ncbi:hypothetical protein AVEN_35519-1 [Araneus ventricosus]|uniref:Uncharacterized protein n=1 Tax=Araneus ventricosus TaxID=182803 RepID=A0A4Y2GPU6_ARAVE|nr:hypothetical protein AVEN_35519-1 [Araneus ventricosus]
MRLLQTDLIYLSKSLSQPKLFDIYSIWRETKCKIRFHRIVSWWLLKRTPSTLCTEGVLKVALETDNQITAVKDGRVVPSLKAEEAHCPYPFITRLPGLLQSFSSPSLRNHDRSGFSSENGAVSGKII